MPYQIPRHLIIGSLTYLGIYRIMRKYLSHPMILSVAVSSYHYIKRQVFRLHGENHP